jgi:hypothetical protein
MPTPTIELYLFDYHVHNGIALSHLSGDKNNTFALFTPYLPGTQTLAMHHLIAHLVFFLSVPALILAVQALLLTSVLLAVPLLLAAPHPLRCSHMSPRVQHMLDRNNSILTVHMVPATTVPQSKTLQTVETKMPRPHLEDPLVRITHTTILTLERDHPSQAPVQDMRPQVSMVLSPR